MQAEMLELMIANAFRVRNKTDYDDFYVVSKDEAQQQLDNAQAFIGFMDGFIADIIKKQ